MQVKIDQEAPAAAPARGQVSAVRAAALPDGVVAARRASGYSRMSSSRSDSFFVGELRKILLPSESSNFSPYRLKKMRAPLALDPDHQRLTIVDAVGQLFVPRREQAVGRPFEEENVAP